VIDGGVFRKMVGAALVAFYGDVNGSLATLELVSFDASSKAGIVKVVNGCADSPTH